MRVNCIEQNPIPFFNIILNADELGLILEALEKTVELNPELRKLNNQLVKALAEA